MNKSKKSVTVKLEKGTEKDRMPRESMVDQNIIDNIMVNKPIKKDTRYLAILGQITGVSIGFLIIGFSIYYKFFKVSDNNKKKD